MRAGGVLWEGMGLHEDLKRLRLVRGLSNDSGLNNCFLNVVIQGLWHLRSFREALLDLKPQVHPPSRQRSLKTLCAPSFQANHKPRHTTEVFCRFFHPLHDPLLS